MGNNMIDNCLNLKIFKYGAKLNIYVLSGLGLIYSFWTQGVFLLTFDLNVEGRYADDQFGLTILKTYIIAYLTTAVALVWGLHTHELRFFKLWGFVKFVEVIFNIASLIQTIFGYRFIEYILVVVVLVLALGFYVIMSVWKLYKSLQDISDSNNEKNIDLKLPKYEPEVPAVHKTTVIN